MGLKNTFGTGTDLSLLNPAGATIATGVAGPTNLDRVISNFSIPSSGVYLYRGLR